ncbi:MAG TPA: class I SAM-dependent methyltransferase, partial [Gammaproteobacteria bacterium]
LELTQKYLTPESDVLEFGCGTGSTALIHAPKVKHILAIDYSQKMVDIANRKLADSGLNNVEFDCATLFDLSHGSESFDAVLALNVLHLLDDHEASIRKAYELLKPGGVFVTSTVCLATKRNPLRLILPLGAALGIIPRVRFLTKEALERDIVECGFTLIEKLEPLRKNSAVFLIARK